MDPNEQTVVSGVSYRPIVGYPGYSAGDDGSIWSKNRGRWQKIKQSNHLGYFSVGLHLNKTQTTKRVHALVCSAFHGPRPAGMQCRHIDGDSRNNVASNLAWGTQSENQLDRRGHGTSNRGVRNGASKLSEDQVREIRRRLEGGAVQMRLAEEFGVDQKSISDIVRRKSWSHIQ